MNEDVPITVDPPRQRCVCQPLSRCAFAQGIYTVDGIDATVPFVRREGELVDIPVAMVHALLRDRAFRDICRSLIDRSLSIMIPRPLYAFINALHCPPSHSRLARST